MRTALVFVMMLMWSVPAAAQESVALAVEGWRQQTGDDGVVTYRCASDVCAKGSVVSYKVQPHRNTITLQDFETHHRRLADQNAGTGNIRDVRLAEPKDHVIDGVRVLQISREVVWADRSVTYTIEARLIGPDKSFSLVSDSPQRDWTVNNFEGFLKPMIDIAGIKAP